ncbi:MAG TPA: F0F1 ATP synthase subunit B [Saprospiraceae bacterium]|nr:F0F1 ATP synthase subunit B [Saprospiraceae bacterium]
MVQLAVFPPFLPDVGIVFWTTLIFLIVLFVLAKYAFGPIQKALKKRELDIQNSLDQANQAREEIAELQSKNEQLLKQAQEERTKILKEAKETKDAIIKEAKDKARDEAQKIVATAQQEIINMKQSVLVEAKNELGTMAIDIAEKVLRQKLAGDKDQEKLVQSLVKEIKFN